MIICVLRAPSVQKKVKKVKLPCHRSVVTSVLILDATFGSMSEQHTVKLFFSSRSRTSTWWHYKLLLPHSQQWNYLGRSPAAVRVRGRGRMLVAKPENQRIWERLVELPPWTCCTPTPSPSKYLKLCIFIPKDLCGFCEHVQAPRAQLSISRRCDQAVWVGHPHHLGENG